MTSITQKSAIQSMGIKKPIVLFFGVPEFIFAQVTRDLKNSPFEFIRAKDFVHIHEAIGSGRFKVGVLFDHGVKDPVGLIQISKKMGESRWITCSRDFSAFTRVKSDGLKVVDFVMEYPILTSKLISKIKSYGDEGYEALNFPNLKKSPSLTIVKTPSLNPILGLERIVESTDFESRRKWISLDHKLFDDVSQSSSRLKDLIHEALKKVFTDMSEVGRLSIVSFGVDGPYMGERPDKFVILSTSEYLSRSTYEKSFACHSYPELLEAARLKSPIFAPDVRRVPAFRGVLSHIERSGSRSLVAIPLMSSSKSFAMIKARIPFVQDKSAINLFSDLSQYSKQLTPFVSHYDFFNRIYRSMKK